MSNSTRRRGGTFPVLVFPSCALDIARMSRQLERRCLAAALIVLFAAAAAWPTADMKERALLLAPLAAMLARVVAFYFPRASRGASSRIGVRFIRGGSGRKCDARYERK